MAIKNVKEVQPNNVNRICNDTKVVGDTITQNDIRIDGTYEGNTQTAGKLVIGEQGKYKGVVTCKYIDVWGNFSGIIHATDVVTFKTGAHFEGEINAGQLVMEAGVFFNGTCTMQRDKIKQGQS